ncbi:MAG TPA: hypothetical protein VGR21_04805 [Cryptosporangiaceae bacterium]|nr:hypothetical protein [Cryptosporangiaceae bacterium]
MTRKIAISVPDDVAARLDAEGTGRVSAYITAAVRQQMSHEAARSAVDALCAELGVTEDDLAATRERVAEVEAWRARRRAGRDAASP